MSSTNIYVTSDFWPKGFDGFMLGVILVLLAACLTLKAVNLLRAE